MSDGSTTAQYDPSWLANYADRLGSNDQEMEAVAFRELAKNWDADKRALQAAHDENTAMGRRLQAMHKMAALPLTDAVPS